MPAPTPLTLHIYRDSALSARHLTLKANDKTTPLYTVSAHSGLSGHANLEIFVPAPSPPPLSSISVSTTPSASPAPAPAPTTKIAEIDFHTFSSRISIHLPTHETALELRSKGFFSRGYYFESQSGTGAGVLVWEVERLGRGMKLVDSQGAVVARFEGRAWAARKEGVWEVLGGGGWEERAVVGNGGEGEAESRMVDEVVVSALAMMEVERRRRSSSAGGGGGGAGGGGA